MVKKNKWMEAVGIQIDTNMDADDYGQRITECVRHLNPDLNVVNLVKVDFGNSSIPADQLHNCLKNLRNMFESVDAKNCIFIPVGQHVGIRDIQIDHVKVVTDESNEGTA